MNATEIADKLLHQAPELKMFALAWRQEDPRDWLALNEPENS